MKYYKSVKSQPPASLTFRHVYISNYKANKLVCPKSAMVTARLTCVYLPVVVPASTWSRKSLITFPVLNNTSPRVIVNANAQSSNVARIAAKDNVVVDHFVKGRFVKDRLVFRQIFSIRSYEIGADGTTSIETLMNLLQDIAVNHATSLELGGDGFVSTKEMCKRNLIWVIAKMHVTVDHYPVYYSIFKSSRDVVEVDTWIAKSGNNSVRREWLVRNSNTGDILARASSIWVMMNTKTRKLAKIPVEVREEIDDCFVESPPTLSMDNKKLTNIDAKTADSITTGLTPRWNDLDLNQHVNNVKYVGWIIESVPLQILKTSKLVGMSLEYRRECMSDSVLQSLTSVVDSGSDFTECQHLLRLVGGADIVKGITKWRCASSGQK